MAGSHPASVRPEVRKPKRDWNAVSEQEQIALDRMLAKCRKNAEPKVEVMCSADHSAAYDAPGAAHPAENTPKLTWKRISSHCMYSGCATYQITLESYGGHTRDSGFRVLPPREGFQCWKQVPQSWYLRLGPHQATETEAIALCEADAS